MDISKIIQVILLSFSGCLVLLLIAVPLFVKLYDRWALQAARRYCEEFGLEYIEAKAWPNYCGLYFRKEGKRLYGSYDFMRNRTMKWKKGSPHEIAERKLKT